MATKIPSTGSRETAPVRMGRDHGYVSRYRARLIVAGLVEPSRRGYLRFTIPYLREFLQSRPDHF